MSTTTLLGFIAATLTTISFVPQALKIIKTKNTAAISLGMYIVFNIGILGWLVYGILLNELPIIIANAITIVLTLTILGYKVKYK
jgi:MtN3 and saliva related transmembrane protein